MTRAVGLHRLVTSLVLLGLASGANAEILKKVDRTGRAGTFATIQTAVNSVPDQNAEPVVIEITPGRYDERIIIPRSKRFITLRGMGDVPADVWIGGALGGPGTILNVQAADFRCQHLTVEDKSDEKSSDGHSAIAFSAQRQAIEDCEIKGTHNTLSIAQGTSAYFHSCLITGTGDVLYGPGMAVVDNCEIQMLGNGTVATPNTSRSLRCGLVFLDCRVKGPSSGSAMLMRPWGADGHSAFIRCSIDEHISPRAWGTWDGRENTCRAEEYASVRPDGKPLDLSERPSWVRQLTKDEGERYTIKNLFSNWDPHPHLSATTGQ